MKKNYECFGPIARSPFESYVDKISTPKFNMVLSIVIPDPGYLSPALILDIVGVSVSTRVDSTGLAPCTIFHFHRRLFNKQSQTSKG